MTDLLATGSNYLMCVGTSSIISPNGVLNALLKANQAEHAEIASLMPTKGTDSQLMVALTFVREIDAFPALRHWRPLEELVSHADPELRELAWHAAAEAMHEDALRKIAESIYVSKPEDPRKQRVCGLLALSAAANLFKDCDLLMKADPEVFGYRLTNGDLSDATIDAFHSFVRLAVEDSVQPGPRAYPRFLWDHGDAIDIIVTKRLTLLREWLTPWLKAHGEVSNLGLLEGWPLIELSGSLIRQGHEEGLILWRKLISAERRGAVKNNHVTFLPLEAPTGSLEENAAKEMLGALTSDVRLASFAHLAILHGHQRWLANLIRSDVASGSATNEARGWRLLGFTDYSEPFINLWDELSPNNVKRGWLSEVEAISREAFNRNRWARRWYEDFLESTSHGQAYANFRLLLGCIDQRAQLWWDWKRMRAAPLGMHLEAYWCLEREALRRAFESATKRRENKMFGISTLRHTQWPWF